MNKYPRLQKILLSKPVAVSILALVDFVGKLLSYWPVWRDFVFKKFLVLTVVGLLLAFITWQRAPYTAGSVLAAIVLSCSVGAVIAGCMHFKITESRIKRRTLAAFASPPLSQFLENGFDNRFKEQLWGRVNNYWIIITPLHGTHGELITIHIPLKDAVKDMNQIGVELSPYFKIVLDNFYLMAKADIEGYTQKLNYFELMKVITLATEKLQLLGMEPFQFAEEK